MESTMMSGPLLISRLLEYGSGVHGASEVVTWTADGPRRSTYAELGRDCARLANALRGLGITGDQRVGTFMWNNEEHFEAYLGVQSMGAVLHAINIRLFPDQMVYVVNHAEDEVVIVDNSLAAPFAKLAEHLPLVRNVIVNGPVTDEVRDALAGNGRAVHDYRELLDAQPDTFEWPLLDEHAPAAMCYTSGTTGNPKGVVYSHRSNFLHTMTSALPSSFDLRQSDRVLAIVPLFHANAWGLPYAGMLTGASMIMPDRFLQAEPLAQMIHTRRPPGDRHVVDPARDHRGLGRGSKPPARAAGAARHHGAACLGDDRDVAARDDRSAAGAGDRRGRVGLPRHPGPAGRAGRGAADRPGRLGDAVGRRECR
jgi:fatty-acyl-CoA synthase